MRLRLDIRFCCAGEEEEEGVEYEEEDDDDDDDDEEGEAFEEEGEGGEEEEVRIRLCPSLVLRRAPCRKVLERRALSRSWV